ncbi:MAG: HNH endonuclease [Planctomycetes bacterium]|nr:HNH endonuclease [Planctomycetota bacterium]
MFERNKPYHRRNDIHVPFGGNAQSGIAPCADHPYVFLFTAPSGEDFGYQDGWLSETQFSYTGEGQVGDMEMVRGNRAIKDHGEEERELHLFEKTDRSGYYKYLGEFRYVSHQIQQGKDGGDKLRSQIVFTLELVPSDGDAAQ